MALKSFVICMLFAVVLNPINLPGQDNGCMRRTIPVGVVDRDWNLVRGLGAANFHGKVRGSDVQILSASIDTSPRRIVLPLDASGSMIGQDQQWMAAKSLAEFLVRFAPPRASIAPMAFADTIVASAEFEEDRVLILKRLYELVKQCQRPQKSRQTALFDAILSAGKTLGPSGFGDVIYCVTDADDNQSRTDPKKVANALLLAGVRLYGVVSSLDLSIRGRVPETEGPSQFRSMVVATGGSIFMMPHDGSPPKPYLTAKTPADAVQLGLQRLYQQMGEFYRVELKLPEAVDRPTRWKLEVIEAKGKSMRGVEIHYPQELMPCTNGGR